MTFSSVRAAPVVPERPRERSDRAWIRDYQRRHQAARLRRYNRVAAAEVENPNTQLNRALAEMSLRAGPRCGAYRGELLGVCRGPSAGRCPVLGAVRRACSARPRILPRLRGPGGLV